MLSYPIQELNLKKLVGIITGKEQWTDGDGDGDGDGEGDIEVFLWGKK